MSWFSNDRNAKVRSAANHFLNVSTKVAAHFPLDPDMDQREDGRIGRITPVVLLPLGVDYSENNLNLGLTRDMSSEGMAVSSLGPIPVGEQLVVGIGIGDEFCAFLAQCVRSQPIGYGFFESGVHLKEVLTSREFMALKEFAQYLQDNPPRDLVALVENADPVA